MELIDVQVNGTPRRVEAGQPLSVLLEQLEIPSERVAVEMNRALVRKRDWASTLVTAGAQLEIVEFVGGG